MIASWINDAQIAVSGWAGSLGWPSEAIFRLVLAAIAGGLVGFEREVRGRQAGFRTHMLVCMGSALVMIVSLRFAQVSWPTNIGAAVGVDPARIAYGVMTGVGFLGAGTIMQHRGSVRGLTTAAALWCVAAVGLAVGFGLYLLSLASVLMMMVALWLLDYIELFVPKTRYRTITLRASYKPGCIDEAVQRVENAGLNVIDVSFDRAADLRFADIHLKVTFIRTEVYYKAQRVLDSEDAFQFIAATES
jgi:putative Mg2+ transporter-C (MgtC) family protein